MIDTLAILVSCFALALVAWRALLLDRVEPWFAPPPPDAGDEPATPPRRTRGRR